jgi:hypothetical protein
MAGASEWVMNARSDGRFATLDTVQGACPATIYMSFI